MAEYEAYKDAEIGKVGSIPAHWETTRIGNLFEEVSDRYETGMPEDLPLLSVSEYYGVAKRSDKIADDSILVRAESLDGYKICRPGDIVSNIMLTWKGALGSSPYAGIVSPAYCVYRPKGEINSRYFHYLFRTKVYTDVFHVNSTGLIDSRLRLYTPKFFALYAPIPPMAEQNVIVEYLDKITKCIDAIIAEAKSSIEEYKAWKASIIYEAVTKGLDPNVEMKDSGIHAIGRIPTHWSRAKIRYLHNGLTDGTHGTFNRVTEGHCLLSSKNVREDELLITDAESYISEEDYKQITCNGFPQKNDLLLCCIGASIGRCIVYELDETMAFQRSVIFIRPNALITAKMLRYAMISESTLTQEKLLINQSAQPGLYQGSVGDIFIALPPISEQNQIVEFLNQKCGDINQIIKEKENLIADLEAYKKSLIFEVVTGKRKVV